MKFVLIFTVTFIVLHSSEAAVSHKANATDPAHPNHCVAGDGMLVARGSSETTKHCTRLDCGDDFTLTEAGCGVVVTEPLGLPGTKCTTKIDHSKPYPGCCPEIVCEDE